MRGYGTREASNINAKIICTVAAVWPSPQNVGIWVSACAFSLARTISHYLEKASRCSPNSMRNVPELVQSKFEEKRCRANILWAVPVSLKEPLSIIKPFSLSVKGFQMQSKLKRNDPELTYGHFY